MSKPRKLSRPEIEGLAEFFGCRVASLSGKRLSEWDIYIDCKGKREKAGTVTTNNPAYLPWSNHDWTKAFQRVSGINGANLWDQGKRGR